MTFRKYKFLLGLFLTAGLVSCEPNPSFSPELGRSLNELDRILERRDELAQIKQRRTDSLRAQLAAAPDLPSSYRAASRLFDEYLKYDVDSALRYAYLEKALSCEMGDTALMNDAALDLAARHLDSGMYQDAQQVAGGIDTLVAVREGQIGLYNHICYNIYHGMATVTHDQRLKGSYREREAKFFQSCLETLREYELEHYTIQAKEDISKGLFRAGREKLEARLETGTLTPVEKTHLYYWMAKTWLEEGNTEQAMIAYARSAAQDWGAIIGNSRSSIILSRLLYLDGDIYRAYRYVTRAYADARRADNRVSLNEISHSFSFIISAYEKRAAEHAARLRWLVFFLLSLLLILAFTAYSLFRNRRRLRIANRKIREHAHRLQESNNIKDAYLGEFLSILPEHIGSLERYRSGLRTTAKSMDLAAIQQELRSDDFINTEWAYHYERFDKIFLGLFPNFIRQFNALIQPDRHIGEDLPEGKLTNELRIFALIRLGVTESSRIAKFLRIAPSTVYNYRVKMRNAALGDRDRFEEGIMRIHLICES